MADKHDQWAETLSAEHSGWLTGFLADEDKVDRRMLWRLGSWGVAAVSAVVLAVLASQSQIQLRRDQFAANDMLNRQAQQIQFVAKETQTEAKRLSSAIETLNGDRDRLYARMTTVEQGLDSVTGSIKRQTSPAAAAPAAKSAAPVIAEAPATAPTPAPSPPTAVSPVAADLPAIPPAQPAAPVVSAAPPNEPPAAKSSPTPSLSGSTPPASTPLVAWKSMIAPPDDTAAKLSTPTPPAEPTAVAPETTASVPTKTVEPKTIETKTIETKTIETKTVEPKTGEAVAASAEATATPVARTEFGVDIGGANSVDGLRAIWRGMSKSHALTGLRPIMIVKERASGLGMQLRLVAGPLTDAAEAAKICATLAAGNRPCETSVFDGQRLAMKTEPAAAEPTAKPAPRKRAAPKPQERAEPAPPPKPVEEPAPPPKPQSSLSSFLGIR